MRLAQGRPRDHFGMDRSRFIPARGRQQALEARVTLRDHRADRSRRKPAGSRIAGDPPPGPHGRGGRSW